MYRPPPNATAKCACYEDKMYTYNSHITCVSIIINYMYLILGLGTGAT